MTLQEDLESLEERIGPKWMRRIKLIVLTFAVYAAMGCEKKDSNPIPVAPDYQTVNQTSDLYRQINEKEVR